MNKILAVAHGLSGDPDWCRNQAGIMKRQLSCALGREWNVEAGLLANPETLVQALEKLEPVDAPLIVWPHFITGGWFVREKLPQILTDLGVVDIAPTAPSGLMPNFFDICLQVLVTQTRQDGRVPSDTDIVLVAHGTRRNREVFRYMEALPNLIVQKAGFRRVVLHFLEQEPFLKEAELFDFDGYCLPLFALPGGHVSEDIPVDLGQAGYSGRVLEPVGVSSMLFAMVARYISSLANK